MTRADIETKTKDIIIRRLNLQIDPATIDTSAPIFLGSEVAGGKKGLGLDSVDALELVVGLNNEFDITITDEDMEIFESVDRIIDFVEKSVAVSQPG